MEVIVGKTAGFCYGVKRAVEGALERLKNKPKDEKIFCLGELVHNVQVNEMLENNGLLYVQNINQTNSETIIRAHGEPKQTYEFASKNNIKILDLTCPNVLKVHKIAQDYSKNGYYIFLTGKAKHPENIGTLSYCSNYSVIESICDVEKALEELYKSNIKKLLLISQTTYDLENFYLVREKISHNISSEIKFDIENTICPATEMRQKETAKLAKNVDCMVIIGGMNSSNTKKLYDIAHKNCENTFWVENSISKDEIRGFKKIGVMAGASTPKQSICNVVNEIYKKNNVKVLDKLTKMV